VTDLAVTDGEIQAVVTDRGRIECDRCVIATNNWGYQTGQMAGVDLPIAPVEHQYVVTEPMDELADAGTSSGAEHASSIINAVEGAGYSVENITKMI
jgi:dimethylglycine oxidase